MPNWVTNNIIVNEKDFNKLKNLLLDENQQIDFNKLIPMPKDLQITSGSCSWETDNDGFSSTFSHIREQINFQDKILIPYLEKFYTSDITQADFYSKVMEDLKTTNNKILNAINKFFNTECISDEHLDTLFKGYFNLQRYGEKDWYDWSCKNWGTKWNASETYIWNGIITFDTAWSSPIPLLQKLAKHIDFKIAYADEDLGSNFGVVEFKNGVGYRIEEIDELDYSIAKYVATLIKGEDCKEYWFDDIEENEEEIENANIDYANKLAKKYFEEII